MATLSAPFAPPLYGRSAFDQMSDNEDTRWPQQYFAQAPILTPQWPNSHTPHLSGRQSLDISMISDESYQPLGFIRSDWSDMDAATPSDHTYEGPEYISALPAPSNHLQIPGASRSLSNPAHSPHSSQGGMSPIPSPMPMPYGVGLVSPPERERRSTGTGSSCSSRTTGRIASDEDPEYIPSENPRQGKKRPRIPHTAVERRYRENLNAHLDKLRQTVPTLACRSGAGKGSDRGDGARPSKCEILNGAIDHIGSLDRENVALRNEVRTLRSRVDSMEAWYRSNSH